MTTKPTAKTTVISDTLAFLYGQFQGAPVIEAILASWADQCQDIEDMLVDVLVLMALPDATGVQLDILGRIVGEPRLGRTDDEYRIAIGARVRGNRSNGTVEDIIAVLVASDDRGYLVQEFERASFQVFADDAMTADAAGVVNNVLQSIKGAGIRADFIYQTVDNDNALTFADADVEQADNDRGLADDTPETLGGYISEVVV
jgi:hypothetical protein